MVPYMEKIGGQLKNRQIRSLAAPRQQESVVIFVIERIKEALMKKELQPGEYLPSEAELTQSLGVGKTSVREALKMLQAMGIVDVRRGQRTRIREHIEDDAINPMMFQLLVEKGTAKDILNFRLMFEQAFTLMAMEYATEEDLKRIRETLERFEQMIEKDSPKAEDDLAFHYAILESTHNLFVIRTGTTILQLFKASIGESVQAHPRVALENHTRIFSAFCRKDENAVKEAIIKSFERWRAFLEREFEGFRV